MNAVLSFPISFACSATGWVPPSGRSGKPVCDRKEAPAAANRFVPWLVAADRTPQPTPLPLMVARHCGLATRFQAWRGRSGRRYVVSVHALPGLPEFSEAVLLAVALDGNGGLSLLGVRTSEQGLSEWPALAEADEVHVHLLARSAAERDEAAADLRVD